MTAAFPRRVVEHRYGGLPLRVELADPLAAGWYDRDWEPLPELQILRQHRLRRGGRVFDLGAHQGVVALMLANAVGPTGQVIAVEPIPHNAAMCRQNAQINGVESIVVRQGAVADHVGTLRFNRGLNGKAAAISDFGGFFDVPAVTVDSLAREYGTPDVVYVDVEGFELRVLAGAQRTLESLCDWSIEVHVGCGIEAVDGSANQVLDYFPTTNFNSYVHSRGDLSPIPLRAAAPAKIRDRFVLTAIATGEAVPS